MMECRTPRFLLEGAIQRFSEVMDLLWFVETTDMDSATSRPWTRGVSYAHVSAGGSHTALLRSDGCAGACGCNRYGQCNIPPLDDGVSYTQVSAGGSHTALLRSDGFVVVCGNNAFGQCNIPPLDDGVSYTQVSAGGSHTALLRSDGRAVACERTFMENVLFRRLKQGRSMFALRCKVETLCCSLILFVRRMKCG